MPRSGGGRSSGGSRSSGPSAGSRSASTSARPGSYAAPPPAPRAQPPAAPAPQVPAMHQPSGRQPGMLGQMAANVGSVAAGSVIGHGISNALFGGRSHDAPPAEQPQQLQQQMQPGEACSVQAKDFVSCLNATGNDTSACAYYLESLKACQQAASQY